MINKEVKYSFSDIVTLPAVISEVDSRSQCNPFDKNGMLPLITAPMYSVVDDKNIGLFVKEKIYGVHPRGCKDESWHVNFTFKAYGLDEFIKEFSDYKMDNYRHNHNDYLDRYNPKKIIIDMANGHMMKLHDSIKKAKDKFGECIFLVVGNIAHPETFKSLSLAGADAVRLGIGTGQACITSCNTSVHYPLASLIDECNQIRNSDGIFKDTMIIADGGMRNFDDIIKALGLGANYVMCGSLFNKMLESAGNTYHKHSWTDKKQKPNEAYLVNQYSEETELKYRNGLELVKEYYGMSTKRAQREMGHENIKTSEGIVKINPVEYTMAQWTENFVHYLRSTMSYTGKKTLDEFIGKVDFQVITPQAFQAFIK
jgi:IMP dehydrogenase/GMP reductase